MNLMFYEWESCVSPLHSDKYTYILKHVVKTIPKNEDWIKKYLTWIIH